MRSIVFIGQKQVNVPFSVETSRQREILDAVGSYDVLEVEEIKDLGWAEDLILPSQRLVWRKRQPQPNEQFILITENGMFKICVCLLD